MDENKAAPGPRKSDWAPPAPPPFKGRLKGLPLRQGTQTTHNTPRTSSPPSARRSGRPSTFKVVSLNGRTHTLPLLPLDDHPKGAQVGVAMEAAKTERARLLASLEDVRRLRWEEEGLQRRCHLSNSRLAQTVLELQAKYNDLRKGKLAKDAEVEALAKQSRLLEVELGEPSTSAAAAPGVSAAPKETDAEAQWEVYLGEVVTSRSYTLILNRARAQRAAAAHKLEEKHHEAAVRTEELRILSNHCGELTQRQIEAEGRAEALRAKYKAERLVWLRRLRKQHRAVRKISRREKRLLEREKRLKEDHDEKMREVAAAAGASDAMHVLNIAAKERGAHRFEQKFEKLLSVAHCPDGDPERVAHAFRALGPRKKHAEENVTELERKRAHLDAQCEESSAELAEYRDLCEPSVSPGGHERNAAFDQNESRLKLLATRLMGFEEKQHRLVKLMAAMYVGLETMRFRVLSSVRPEDLSGIACPPLLEHPPLDQMYPPLPPPSDNLTHRLDSFARPRLGSFTPLDTPRSPKLPKSKTKRRGNSAPPKRSGSVTPGGGPSRRGSINDFKPPPLLDPARVDSRDGGSPSGGFKSLGGWDVESEYGTLPLLLQYCGELVERALLYVDPQVLREGVAASGSTSPPWMAPPRPATSSTITVQLARRSSAAFSPRLHTAPAGGRTSFSEGLRSSFPPPPGGQLWLRAGSTSIPTVGEEEPLVDQRSESDDDYEEDNTSPRCKREVLLKDGFLDRGRIQSASAATQGNSSSEESSSQPRPRTSKPIARTSTRPLLRKAALA